jgi:hypothetical protein
VSEADWLNDEAQEARLVQKQKEVEFAQNYLIFRDNPQAKTLLQHWDKCLLRKRIPVCSELQQYAAVEAVRDFIQRIHEQIELAETGGSNAT